MSDLSWEDIQQLKGRVTALEAICADAISVIEHLAPTADTITDRAYGWMQARELRKTLNQTMGRT